MRFFPHALLIILFLCAYLIRFESIRVSFKEGDRVRVSGRLSEEPTLENGRQKLTIGQFRVWVERFPEYHYGDEIRAEGVATRGKGGWYLKESKVREAPAYAELRRGKRVPQVLEVLADFRQRILTLYDKFLPEPQSSLLKGVVLGTKSSLDLQFFDALRKTGTLHVVVASGGNIALLAGNLLKVLAVLVSRRRAVIVSIVSTWLYVFLVGWQPAIVRAAVMGTIAFGAQFFGREAWSLGALLISGGLLLLLYPLWLFDVGFQLSFAATAGILLFEKRISSTITRLPLVLKMFRENLSTSLAAQIAVAPILALHFQQSFWTFVISPFANALVLWTIPWIMAGGVGMAGVGIIWEGAARVVAWFVWIPLTYFIKVVELF